MFAIQHVKLYRYAQPVRLEPQRLMFRPRDSNELRLLSSALTISPPAAAIRWTHDVFGNAVAVAEFDCEAAELRIQSDIVLERSPQDGPAPEMSEYARYYPFSYASEEIPDLARLIERHHADPAHALDQWARQFVVPPSHGGQIETRPMLERMMHAIKSGFSYLGRDEENVQSPVETLEKKCGNCRDFALMMMEAVRSLGFAARFVSGYVYDPSVESGSAADPVQRADESGAAHAWMQIYLPGAGWVEFDPSKDLVGGRNLIRVAVARDPTLIMPLSGDAPAERPSMEVSVRITAHENLSGLPMPEAATPPPTFTDVAVQPGKGGAQSVAA